jgi:hypothetical protein
MQRKLTIAAAAMPVRDHPIASAMGWRKTLRVSMAPKPTQVMTMPTATTTQPYESSDLRSIVPPPAPFRGSICAPFVAV